MSLFGKILVFVNLALSFLMATWALGVYVKRNMDELLKQSRELSQSPRPKTSKPTE